MRVSEFYSLNRNQPSLDFLDVDIQGDVRIWIDPRAIQFVESTWGNECVSLIQNFFHTVLKEIKNGNRDKAVALLAVLGEPNETHLGFSSELSRGHGLGRTSSKEVGIALADSEAAKSGLLEDLEDTILMVEGISTDIVSDIATNIIRGPLLSYTQEMCEYHGIPLEENIASGPLWDPENEQWYTAYVKQPLPEGEKLLLVPKAIVRRKMDFQVNDFYRNYVLTKLQEVELSANSSLVQLLKDGRRKVLKKDLIKKYGQGKTVLIEQIKKHPELLDDYRSKKDLTKKPPLTHIELASATGSDTPDWDTLLRNVLNNPYGKAGAYKYEDSVEQLLTALFYPSLVNPKPQHRIHDGRKRVDIAYTNLGAHGFFQWLSIHYSCANFYIECKNYEGDIGNPELDQLSGRFSPGRGQVGFLVCRNFNDKNAFVQRCRDTALDQRGYIIPLDDSDLKTLVEASKVSGSYLGLEPLKSWFDRLV